MLYELAYILATSLVKLSIGLFLLQFTCDRVQTYTIYCVNTINVIYTIFVFFFALFQCRPVSDFWSRAVRLVHGSCIDPGIVLIVFYTHAAIICVIDLIFAIVPIFIVRILTLSYRTKCYVAAILALGSM